MKIHSKMLWLEQIIDSLRHGQQVTFTATGQSMLPFIRGGRDEVTVSPRQNYAVGDIVLALTHPDGKPVLHRIYATTPDGFQLMGDANLTRREQCTRADVLGAVSEIIHPCGHAVSCLSPHHRRRARLWRRLLPIRRYLLWIYRLVSA